jgi:hypothetical protein
MKNNNLVDIFKFLALFTVTFIIESKAPSIIVGVFYIFTLYLFMKSKKNYFWIAYLLIIYNYTAGVFGAYHDIFSIGNFSLSYIEAFSIIAFLKTIKEKNKLSIYYRNQGYLFFGYFVFLIIYCAK